MDYVDPFPTTLPSSTDQANFDTRADAFYGHLPTFVDQLNALPPILAAAAGTAVMAFKFKTATSGDPGSGGVLLNNATQASATGANIDLLDALGNDVSGRLARLGAGTSTVKGELVLTKVGDGRVWLSFEVTSGTSPSGYRALVLQNGLGSSSNPFSANDDIAVAYVAAGAKGDTGPPLDVAPDFLATEVGAVPSAAGRVTRLLNTVDRNRFGWTFASNQLTLPAGDYVAWATAGGSGISTNYPVLRNVTDSTDILIGVAGKALQVTDLQFWAAGFIPHMTFSLAASKVVRLDHLMAATTGGATLDVGGQKGAALAIWKRS